MPMFAVMLLFIECVPFVIGFVHIIRELCGIRCAWSFHSEHMRWLYLLLLWIFHFSPMQYNAKSDAIVHLIRNRLPHRCQMCNEFHKIFLLGIYFIFCFFISSLPFRSFAFIITTSVGQPLPLRFETFTKTKSYKLCCERISQFQHFHLEL